MSIHDSLSSEEGGGDNPLFTDQTLGRVTSFFTKKATEPENIRIIRSDLEDQGKILPNFKQVKQIYNQQTVEEFKIGEKVSIQTPGGPFEVIIADKGNLKTLFYEVIAKNDGGYIPLLVPWNLLSRDNIIASKRKKTKRRSMEKKKKKKKKHTD